MQRWLVVPNIRIQFVSLQAKRSFRQFLDIAAPGFDAVGHGLDAAKVHREMHVKVGDEVHVGVKAFLAIWRRIPGFGWMARLGGLPFVYPFLWLGYAIFARVRPFLPRRKADCDSGTCQR